MQSLVGIAEMMKGDAGGLVPFAVGEMFGPCRCEHDGCEAKSWIVWMTPEEYNAAKSQDDHPVSYVFKNRIGKALCDEHRPVSADVQSEPRSDNG